MYHYGYMYPSLVTPGLVRIIQETYVVDPHCILSLYKDGITGFQVQAGPIVFVARGCNIPCILHQDFSNENLSLNYTNDKSSYFAQYH